MPGASAVYRGGVVSYWTSVKHALLGVEQSLLDRYGAAEPGGIAADFDAYAADWDAARAAEAEAQRQAQAEQRLRESQTALQSRLEALLTGAAPEEKSAETQLRQAEAEASALSGSWAMARGRLDTLGDRVVLSSRLQEAEEELRLQARQEEALALALAALEDANEELQSRLSPALTRRTAQLMGALTGGRYSEVSLARDLTALVKRQTDAVGHETAFLSRGTCDQFYLALRLALCELTLPAEDACPLVLDDALLAFDDERMGYALELLRRLAGKRQILLFTCQKRENEWLAAHPEG